jgi:hypothetical protein
MSFAESEVGSGASVPRGVSWLTEFDAPVDVLEECLDEKPFNWLIIAKRLP